ALHDRLRRARRPRGQAGARAALDAGGRIRPPPGRLRARRDGAEQGHRAGGRTTERMSPVHHVKRWMWLLLANLALGLGIVGVFLPGLPTTPFILLAAFAAARGSKRLHAWMLAHRTFGPMIRDWQATGAVTRRAKWWATSMMALSAAIMF